MFAVDAFLVDLTRINSVGGGSSGYVCYNTTNFKIGTAEIISALKVLGMKLITHANLKNETQLVEKDRIILKKYKTFSSDSSLHYLIW